MPFIFFVGHRLSNKPNKNDNVVAGLLLGLSFLGIIWLIYGENM